MVDTKRYEQFGIQVEEQGDTTHIFKDGTLIGSFTIDLEAQSLKFNFPDSQYFNYFAYMASDPHQRRVQWVNENFRTDSMDALQAGVAFLGFAKFEEVLQYAKQNIPRPSETGQRNAIH